MTFQFQLVEIAFNSDINKGISLLERRNARWGDRNTLELSCIGNLRSFIASKYYLLNTHLCTVSTFGSKSDNLLDLQEIVTTYHPSHKGSSKYILLSKESGNQLSHKRYYCNLNTCGKKYFFFLSKIMHIPTLKYFSSFQIQVVSW